MWRGRGNGYTRGMKTERPHSLRALVLFPLAASALLLSACGNKGPLVLPQKPVPVEEVVEPVEVPAEPEQTLPASDAGEVGQGLPLPPAASADGTR